MANDASYSVADLIANLSTYRFNPAAIQRESLKMLTAVSNGTIDFVDPTNPVVLCLEVSAAATAAFMVEHAVESRRRYPKLAQDQEDLYLHMSDKDYADRFATPATATFTFFFEKDKLLNSLKDEPSTGYKKITIPRNTYFEIANMQFALQYPIDIRQLAHGGLQVVYDTTKMSPLQTLETNSIDHEVLTNAQGDWVSFSVLATQFSVVDNTESIGSATDFSMKMQFTDLFYYARVYHQNIAGTWDELAITHSDTNYDINVPTAVLQVVDTTLTIKIPQIYVTTGQLSRKIRVELYQTKGAINIALGEYPSKSMSISWKAYDPADITTYVSPLSTLTVLAASQDTVIAGSNGLSFEQLRTNVIQNTTGPIDSPITPAQIEKALQDKGYSVVKNIDNITNRVFLATRPMPTPTLVTPTTAATTSGNQLLTAASASIETLSFNTNEIVQLPTVVDNGSSITIMPNTIYQTIDGITQPVQASVLSDLLALPADKRAQAITQGNYLYTPFHNVLDMSNNAFETRPYYLDNPNIDSKVFVRQNDTTLLQVATDRFQILRNDKGYSIIILTKSDSNYQALDDTSVFVQLSYIPYGERDRAHLNGKQIAKTTTGERYFQFDLVTNYNVDMNDNIEFTTFTMYNADPRITHSSLLNSFDILYSTSSVMPATWVVSQIDKDIGKYLLPLQSVGIAHETLRVQLGYSLSRLWTRARTVVGSTPYRTWAVDVPSFYSEDIYQRDANGSAVQIVNGAVVIDILHHRGDPVLDANGNQQFDHRIGDIMYDNGVPVAADVRGLIRQIDLFLLEGAYWFATDATTSDYRQRLVQLLVSWLVNDLDTFTAKLLDQTRIYFYPKTTAGLIQVLVGDSVPKFIDAGQSFNITLAVSKQVFANTNLRDRLSKTTITVISDALDQKTVALSQIIQNLRDAYGSDVIDVQTNALGGSGNYSVVTVVNDTDRLSIRKRLTALADDTLIAEEDVTINFVQHGS